MKEVVEVCLCHGARGERAEESFLGLRHVLRLTSEGFPLFCRSSLPLLAPTLMVLFF